MRYPEQTGYLAAKCQDCSCDDPMEYSDTKLPVAEVVSRPERRITESILSAPELEKALEDARRQKLSQTLR